MGATGTRAVPGLALPAGLPSPSAGYGPTGGAKDLLRQPGTPKGAKDDMLDETLIDVMIPPFPPSSAFSCCFSIPKAVGRVVPDPTAH